MPVPPSTPSNDYEKEWEKSSGIVDKFDQILIDLRKLGFSFVTGLIAAGSVFQLGLNIQNGIIQATMALIAVLYWLDVYYQNVLTGALLRAQFLELFRLKYATSYYISGVYNKARLDAFITVIYLGLVLSAGIIGLSVNILENENDVNKVTKLQYSSNNPSGGNSSKLDIALTQSNANVSSLPPTTQDKYIGPILKAISSSILNVVGMIIFVLAIGIIVYIHVYGVKKKKIYQQVNQTYNYFSLLVQKYKDETSIDIDDIEFLINTILYGDIQRNMYRDNIIIHGKEKSNSSLQEVSVVLLVRESNAKAYSHWVIISKVGILVLLKSRLGKPALSYFRKVSSIQTFESPEIFKKDVDRINIEYIGF